MKSLKSFLLVSDLIPKQFGGGPRFLAELGRRSREQGVRMGMVLAGEPIPEVADAFRSQEIAWWTLPDWKVGDRENRRRFVKGFRQVNARESWDVVAFEHCNPLSVIWACSSSRIRDGRHFASVWHQHQGIPSPRGIKKYVSTIRLLAPFMNAYAAVCDMGATSFRERSCPAGKIKVIRYGIRLPKTILRDWLRRTLGLEQSARLIVTAASLIHRKGLDVLVEAVTPLFKEFPQWHLVIVGGGPLLAQLREMSDRLEMSTRIHFLGISNQVPNILADCDIFVLASRNEAMPISILEAMASSLPVVATDVGYVREIVVNGTTGFLVPSDDPQALCAALRSLLLDQNLMSTFGARGRERVEKLFTLDRQVAGYLDLYRSVLLDG